MGKLMVEVKNVSKSFGDNVVLDHISFNVEEGENFVVFGKSGSGKSVLLKCLVGLMEPDSGEIKIDGRSVLNIPINELNEIRKHIGFLFSRCGTL